MGQQRKAKRRSSKRRSRRRRRKFYESPTWNWPQFDPESCQQCGHVIPMHATGWILQEYILCESCFKVLDEESQRRGSVTIAPGVVLLRDDLPEKAVVEVAPPKEVDETPEPIQASEVETAEPLVAVTEIDSLAEAINDEASTEPAEIDQPEAVLVAAHHVVAHNADRTFHINLDYEPLPPSEPEQEEVIVAHHAIAATSDRVFEVNLDYEPLPPSEPELPAEIEHAEVEEIVEPSEACTLTEPAPDIAPDEQETSASCTDVAQSVSPESQPVPEQAAASIDEVPEDLTVIESLSADAVVQTGSDTTEADLPADAATIAPDGDIVDESINDEASEPAQEMAPPPVADEQTAASDESPSMADADTPDPAPIAPSIPALAAMPVAQPEPAAVVEPPETEEQSALNTPSAERHEHAAHDTPQESAASAADSAPAPAPTPDAPTESSITATPPVETAAPATPAPEHEPGPVAADSVKPPLSPPPAKARRRRARRRRHPVDAWLEALANEKPEAIVHRAMAKQSFPPGFDPQEHARLLDLANHLRNRWLENTEPRHAARSA